MSTNIFLVYLSLKLKIQGKTTIPILAALMIKKYLLLRFQEENTNIPEGTY